MELTQRQKRILAAIVETYAEVASPVGSVGLARIFDVSSATIRNEMAELEKKGYIEQPHTSAGRIPTDKGYRLFVNELMEKTDIQRPSKVMDTRVKDAGQADQAIRSAVKTLVEITQNIGLATIGDSLYVRGYTNLFLQPEFSQITAARGVASLLDDLEPWLRETSPDSPLSVYIGQENPIGKASGCSLIIASFASPFSDQSYIGVLGPTRQDYSTVTNLVRHKGLILERSMEEYYA